jgi:hypothetical protein
MRILAIDPGTEKSGFVLFDSNTKSIIESGIVENEELLHRSTWSDADFLAIEMVNSFGQAVGRTTFETVLWIGRFIQYGVSNGIKYEKLYKKVDINTTLCFSNKVKDSNIRQAILDMFEPTGGGKTPQIGTKAQPGPLYGVSSHAISALAVALTYCLKNKLIER